MKNQNDCMLQDPMDHCTLSGDQPHFCGCETACQAACQTACQQTCEQTCQTQCKASCQSACERSHQ